MEEDFTNVRDALYETLMNTPCKDPVDSVLALCSVMCDILVQLELDDTERVCDSVSKTLDIARKTYAEQELH